MKKYEKYLGMMFTSEELETLFAYGPTAKRETFKFDKSFTGIYTKFIILWSYEIFIKKIAMHLKYL